MDVAVATVELGSHDVNQIGDLPRDELLHARAGAVVVGAIGDSDSIAFSPTAHLASQTGIAFHWLEPCRIAP